MRRLFKNKSKFLAGICCLCLGVASLLAGAFSFVKAPAMAEEVVDANAGFYVEKGASFRYDTTVPAIRFGVSLTKEQWEAYKLDKEYTDEMVVKIEASIGITDRPNEDTTLSSGYARVFQDVSVKTINNYFANAKNEGKPFTVKPAVILTNTWKGETTEGKTSAQLNALYAGAEFHVAGIRLSVNGDVLATKDTGDNRFIDEALTLRSVRSLSASLLAQNKVADEYKDIANAFLVNADGSLAEIVKEDIKAYYDKYAGEGTIDVTEIDTVTLESADKVAIGSTKVKASGVVDGKVTISEAEALVDGETYIVNYDCGDKIYSLNGLIAATEIFYQTNSKGETGVTRLNARFAITANADTLVKTPTVETYTDEDGNTYSMTVYGVNRGYYVMGSDIDFGGTWFTRSSATSDNGIRHVDLNSAAFNYSGLIGFGGTFDGNGYAIKNLRFNKDVTSTTGIFGALAYGATVKNLAIIDAHPRDYNETHRETSLIARYAGSDLTVREVGIDGKKVTKAQMEENYKYLVAKYGSTDCITIDNCYFHVNDTMLKDSLATGGATLSYKYDKGTDSIFQRHKTYNSTGQYTLGSFTVTYEGYSDFVTIKNSVLDIPKDEDTLGTYNNAGTGWIGRTVSGGTLYDDFTSLENCYQIAGESSFGKKQLGFKYEHVSYNKDGTWIATSNILDGYERRYNNFYGYAANDYADIADGTRVYTGLDADGKFVFVVPTEENGYTANTSVYHYQGLHRYDNYVDMSANNNASIVGFNDNWAKVGGAVIWKGLADASADKTLTLALYKKVGDDYELTDDIGLGDTIKVEAFYNGEEVTSATTLSTDNTSMLAISDNTFTVEQGGEATLYATAGSYTAEYSILASAINNTAVTISSNYSEVYGLETAYSMPYIANGKDLVATDFLTLYRNHFVDNDATISAVYMLDENGEKTELTAVDVEGVSQYLFANAGNVKQELSIIVDGSKGYMSFADISSVTAVITDTAGFKYIPSTTTTRAGYYLLANDYNDLKITVNESTTYNYLRNYFKLPVMGATSNEVGYSFGGLDLDALAEYNKNSTFASVTNKETFAYRPFVGTFDGLGHTIDNLMIEPMGLLGRYQTMDQSSTLKNVKLTNVHAAYYMWVGTYNSSGLKNGANGTTNVPRVLLAVFENKDGADYEVVSADKQVKIENVSIEMAPSHLHRKDVNAYQGLGNYAYWSVFSMSRSLSYDSSTDKYSTGSVGTPKWTNNKINTNNLVIKYDITERANIGAEGGYMFFNTSIDESYGNGAYRQANWTFKDVKNTYLIVNPVATGRTPFITNNRFAGDSAKGYPKQVFVGLPYNDYEAYLGTDESMNYSYNTYKYTMTNDNRLNYATTAGCGYVTTTLEDGSTTKEFIYSRDIDNYTLAGNQTIAISTINSATYCTFYKTNIYRYDTYAAMAAAGKTQVGNFAISADGIVWSPAK